MEPVPINTSLSSYDFVTLKLTSHMHYFMRLSLCFIHFCLLSVCLEIWLRTVVSCIAGILSMIDISFLVEVIVSGNNCFLTVVNTFALVI